MPLESPKLFDKTLVEKLRKLWGPPLALGSALLDALLEINIASANVLPPLCGNDLQRTTAMCLHTDGSGPEDNEAVIIEEKKKIEETLKKSEAEFTSK